MRLGIEKKLKDILTKIEGIKQAYIFGSYASNSMDSSSDIDILAVGSHSVLELQRAIAKAQKDTGREFNITNLSLKEFERKKKEQNPFISNIFSTKTIKLI